MLVVCSVVSMESGAVVTWAGADMVTGGVVGVVVTAELGSVILIYLCLGILRQLLPGLDL